MKNLTLLNIMLSLVLSVFASCAMAGDSTLLDQTHAALGLECNDCHTTKPRQAVSMLKCVECHDTKELAEATADVKPTNPHKNRHFSTETDCSYCHHQHKKSENYCGSCHLRFDFVIP